MANSVRLTLCEHRHPCCTLEPDRLIEKLIDDLYVHCFTLHKHIPAIDNGVTSSLIGRSIACQVQEKSLNFLHVTHTSQRGHTVRFVDAQRRSAHLGVEEARRDYVDSCKVAPFAGQTLTEMIHRGFRRVVDLDMSDVDMHRLYEL